jgi:hypothetical protein
MMTNETVLQMNLLLELDTAFTVEEDPSGALDWDVAERAPSLGSQQTSMALVSLGSRESASMFDRPIGMEFTSWLTVEEAMCPHCRAVGYQVRYSVGRACRIVEGRCFRCGSSRRSIHEPGEILTGPR